MLARFFGLALLVGTSAITVDFVRCNECCPIGLSSWIVVGAMACIGAILLFGSDVDEK